MIQINKEIQGIRGIKMYTCLSSVALSSISAAIAETSGKSLCSCLGNCLYCNSGGFGADDNSRDNRGEDGVEDPSTAFSTARDVPGVGAADDIAD